MLSLFLVLVLILGACSNTKAPERTKEETKAENVKKKSKENTKEDAEKSLAEVLAGLKKVANEDNLKKMVANKEAWKEIIPKELHSKIHYFDTFSGPGYENLAWQTLMSIAVVYSKEENKVDDKTKKLAIESMPLDKKRGYTIAPLGLYGKNLIGYYVDMVYDSTSKEWKIMPYNLTNQMILIDIITRANKGATKK